MNLKEIVALTDKKDIMNEMMQLFPECKPHRKEIEQVCDFLYETPTMTFDDFEINISVVDPSEMDEAYDEEIDEEPYVVVSGYSQEADLVFALGFAKWEEWANADIRVDEEVHLSNEALVSICLYEMTFYGYDQETIADELRTLEKGLSSEMYH